MTGMCPRPDCIFQSTPPARGATGIFVCSRQTPNISIHAPREGGDNKFGKLSRVIVISIHAPREGGDGKENFSESQRSDISIHAPREGGDSIRC